MNKSTIFMSALLLIASCGGGGQSDTSKKRAKIILNSQFDPCIEKDACTVVRNLDMDTFISLLKADKSRTKAKIGTKVKSYLEHITFEENDDGSVVECRVTYNQSRTLLKVEGNINYIKEKKSKFKLHSKEDICKETLVDLKSTKTGYAKELAFSANPEGEDQAREHLKNTQIQTLRYKGDIVVRISGPTKISLGDGIDIEGVMLTMFKITGNSFSSEIIDFSKNEFVMDLVRQTGSMDNINVSNFKLSEIDPADIDDRTEK